MRATSPLTAETFLLPREDRSYSSEENEVWSILYEKRMRDLRNSASSAWLTGAEAIGLRHDRVPALSDINRRLALRTGWQAVPVSGFIPSEAFFGLLAERRFPTTITVRSRAALDYVPEPDIFHDVFGHVPLHAEPSFARLLQQFGQLAARAEGAGEMTRVARLFWFTIEFGLIREGQEIKVYGSGLISSAGDCANALSGSCEKRPFSLEGVMNQPFEIDHFQQVLFVAQSFEEISDAVRSLLTERRRPKAPAPSAIQ